MKIRPLFLLITAIVVSTTSKTIVGYSMGGSYEVIASTAGYQYSNDYQKAALPSVAQFIPQAVMPEADQHSPMYV